MGRRSGRLGSSPLIPAEPFDLLDVELRSEISFDLRDAHNAIVYVVAGGARVRVDDREPRMAGGQEMALHGSGGRATFRAVHPARLIILSGAEIREAVLAEGPFIMNERSQIEAGVAQYGAGLMGHLAPLGER